MGAVKAPKSQDEFTIDFRSTPPIRILAFKDRLGLGGITFVRGSSHPIEGLRVRSSQVTVAIHEAPEENRAMRYWLAGAHIGSFIPAHAGFAAI
jgi:hypothetical protein